ncbi:hypothetical protein BC835DRAFT_1310426 [Cytidiella melzeri]|nr:hypothetical protein BC835DRAFT_1310426 [Cytidiella melzeri]
MDIVRGSSEMVAASVGDLSIPTRVEGWEEDVLDGRDHIERVEEDVPNCGVREPADDARDSFEARQERAAVMNRRVSCSVTGEGPGTGGRGLEGGRDRGGFGLGSGLEALRLRGVVASGVVEMCDGGAGNKEMRRGTRF